ncbi:tyrosine-type recombinase/integrase [Pandoraea sp. PE-S2R-1]|uniref:tyrosine-type recombinase/integrase n=1 Tax=Pandoraea sp. PE-S2R-1 TaxID=1986994 RepID=UPI000B3FEF96|nr:tyrosine-type recombinase/integrase [Pandoraea sp. PE-S2R-1]
MQHATFRTPDVTDVAFSSTEGRIPPSQATREHLGLEHFALFRGYLEGLPLERLADQYLETGLDLRRAKTTLRWIREQLVTAARRERDFTGARVLGIAPQTLIDSSLLAGDATHASSIPTLEAFAEAYDPYECFSQKELLALFQEAHPEVRADRRQARNDRLRASQMRALVRLQQLLVVKPQIHHHVRGWFHQAIAGRLETVGILTLLDLIAFIRTHGPSWHARVHRMGPVAATRLQRWLDAHEGSLGQSVPAYALVPRRAAGLDVQRLLRPQLGGVAPLEFLSVPTGLGGQDGHNRMIGGTCRLMAADDLSAVQAWLATLHPIGGNTWRSYRSHAERFLNWAWFERGKALSDVGVEDCAAYREFLAAPAPHWIASRHLPRYSATWRPFAWALAPASIRLSMTVLQRQFNWLMAVQFLRYNPWLLIAKPKPGHPHRGANRGRSLSQGDWGLLKDYLDRLNPVDPIAQRRQFVLRFAYATGLRLSELASARVGDLSCEKLDGLGMRWRLVVTGKGENTRVVELATVLVQMLQRYLTQRGLGELIEHVDPDVPLIGRLGKDAQRHPRQPLSPSGLAHMLRQTLTEAASVYETVNPGAANQIRQATPHWLRHTFGTHAVARGAALDVVKDQMGHASLATTSQYLHPERRKRAEDMDNAFGAHL